MSHTELPDLLDRLRKPVVVDHQYSLAPRRDRLLHTVEIDAHVIVDSVEFCSDTSVKDGLDLDAAVVRRHEHGVRASESQSLDSPGKRAPSLTKIRHLLAVPALYDAVPCRPGQKLSE